MEKESAATKAVKNLNGHSVKGRPIKVEKSLRNFKKMAGALKTDGSTRHSPGYCDLRAERTTSASKKDSKFPNRQNLKPSNVSKMSAGPSPASELARWLKSDPQKILGSSRSPHPHSSRPENLKKSRQKNS